MTTEEDSVDLSFLDESSTIVTLQSGMRVKVERLKLRATMALLKILTRGAAPILADLFAESGAEDEEFATKVLGSLLLSVPEAPDETVEFLLRIVSPADLRRNRVLSKDDKFTNTQLQDRLTAELSDAELDDVVTIITAVITQERPHLQALGKRLALLMSGSQGGQTSPKLKESSDENSESLTPAT